MKYPSRILSSLERLALRALDPSKRWDYLIITLIAAWPVVFAAIIGVHVSEGEYAGYWTRPNWMVQVVGLPVALLLFRWASRKIAAASEPWPPSSLPGLVGLVADEGGREKAYEALRRTLTSPWNVLLVLVLLAFFHAFDMWGGVLEYYVSPVPPDVPAEKDWSVMFLLGTVSPTLNLLQVVFAYTSQFTLLAVLLLFVVMTLRHNLFFLGRVYQRRRVPQEQESEYVVIDLRDPDQCFGFRRANEAFNIQVWCLIIAGTGLLTSRVANVTDQSATAFYGLFRGALGAGGSTPVTLAELFPDVGQWVIAGAWLGALFIVSIPALVKLLPLGHQEAHRNVTTYLKEFLPDSYWPYGDDPSNEEVDALAARFSENAFWPSGNNRAKVLFFGSFLVLLLLLVPLKLVTGFRADFVVWLSVMIALALGATALTLKVLNVSLAYVDPRLVQGHRHLSRFRATGEDGVPLEDRFDGRVFITCFRKDAGAYAGRLRHSLEDWCYPDRLLAEIRAAKGEELRRGIEENVSGADVLIVVIGERWIESFRSASAQDGVGSDPVSLAIEVALSRQSTHVIPVLVGKSQMPSGHDLPQALRPLARRNAIDLSDTRWDYDVERLVGAMKGLARSRHASTQAVALGSRFQGHIFISYRRGGATPYAGRLRDTLDDFCYSDRIFRDIETIPGGEDFPTAIDAALAKADVVLVLIGPGWLDAAEDGAIRLHHPDDWVRQEVSAALSRDDVAVIPVLVGEAPMPSREDLPELLQPLLSLTPFVLGDREFDSDVGRLVLRMKQATTSG